MTAESDSVAVYIAVAVCRTEWWETERVGGDGGLIMRVSTHCHSQLVNPDKELVRSPECH